jgi:hypothetical protein
MLFALYCGKLTGGGQVGTLSVIFLAALCTVTLLVMRGAVWLLLPIFWTLAGQIPIMPLPFAVRDLVVMFVFVACLVLKAMKIFRRKASLTLTDGILFVMLVYVATVFLRNPVGVAAVGSERVGGRPYLNTAIAFMAYLVLARVALTERQSIIMPYLIAGGRMIEGFLSIIAFRFPQLVPFMSQFYTTITRESFAAQDVRRPGDPDAGSGRRYYLMYIGYPLMLVLCAKFRPLTLINPLYVVRFLLFAVALAAVFRSGFRSILLASMMAMLLSSYFRRGWIDTIRLSVLGAVGLLLLIALQGTVLDLPLAAQRALSFLPGRWDPVAVREAKGSTEWRVEMWKAMLTTNKYIDNRLLGDGFGFTKAQLARIYSMELYGSSADQQENLLIVGGVHSGPVSAIRFVGYVGFGLFLLLLGAMSREAWRIIMRARDTVHFPMALFICIPIVWEPLNYVFVFGGFDTALPDAIFNAGMLGMLRNTLSLSAQSQRGVAENTRADTLVYRRREIQPASA